MKYLIIAVLAFTVAAFASDLKSPNIGDSVPSFTLKSYEGKEYELKKLLKENKYTVLMFMSTECPVSNGYNDRMEKLYETYNKKGIAIVGVNANIKEDVKRIAEHAKEHGFKFTILKDIENKVADLYGAQVTPETFVISAAGKLVYHGRIDDSRNPAKVTSNDLANVLEKLLKGKELTATTLKAFGCSIKRIVTD